MNKNKIFGFVAMGAALLLIISLFLPFVSYSSISQSLWKMKEGSRVLILLLSLVVIALYLFNKKTELSYITAGFVLFHMITIVIEAKGLEYLSVGFYFMVIASIAIGVVTFLYNEKEVTPLINLSFANMKNTVQTPNPQQPNMVGYNQNINNQNYVNPNNNNQNYPNQ